MKTRLHCKTHPLLFNGMLSYVCDCGNPRYLTDEKGFYLFQQGEKISFNDLRTIGKEYSDRFGKDLINYDKPRV